MKNENIITSLNNLIETCKDGQEGYKDAAEGVENTAMKNVFYRFSQERAKFAGELQQLVRELGGEPEDSSSMAGALHRGWINIKSAVTGQDEISILNECVNGEEIAVNGYKLAMDNKDLPNNVRETLERQYKEVQGAYKEVTEMNTKRKTANA